MNFNQRNNFHKLKHGMVWRSLLPPISVKLLTLFRVKQKVTYKGKLCIIESFPVSDMVVVRNLDYTPGDWITAKTYTKELKPIPAKAQIATPKLESSICNCPTSIIFTRGCQCGGS